MFEKDKYIATFCTIANEDAIKGGYTVQLATWEVLRARTYTSLLPKLKKTNSTPLVRLNHETKFSGCYPLYNKLHNLDIFSSWCGYTFAEDEGQG